MTEYKCTFCGTVFESAWSDEEAREEFHNKFTYPIEEASLVCDDCYKAMGFEDEVKST